MAYNTSANPYTIIVNRKTPGLPSHTACSTLSVKGPSNGRSIWIDLADRMKDFIYFPSPLEVGLLSLVGALAN